MVQACAKHVQKEGTNLRDILPEENIGQKKKWTVVYCTQLVSTRKIEVTTEKIIYSYLQPSMEAATYKNRSKKFETVEVRFATEKEAVKH